MCVPVGQRRTKTRSPPARDPIYIVFRRRNVSEIGHFFMDGVVEVKALDSMGVSSALSALANPWLGRHTVGSTSYHVVSRYREMSRPLLNLRTD